MLDVLSANVIVVFDVTFILIFLNVLLKDVSEVGSRMVAQACKLVASGLLHELSEKHKNKDIG